MLEARATSSRHLDKQAEAAYAAYMQYTLRKVSRNVDAALRRRARAAGKSLNAVALEALARGAGLADEPVAQRDLTDIAGTWVEDTEFDRERARQHRIDRRLWR